MWKCECDKGAVNMAVRFVFEDCLASTKDVELSVQTSIVKVKTTSKSGELVLAAATCHAERKDTAGYIPCGKYELGGPQTLFVAPMFTPPINSRGEPNKEPFL